MMVKYIETYYRRDGTKVSGHPRADSKNYSYRSRAHQTGTSNKVHDQWNKALHPGKRISEAGNIYYENRRNRSDINRRLRL